MIRAIPDYNKSVYVDESTSTPVDDINLNNNENQTEILTLVAQDTKAEVERIETSLGETILTLNILTTDWVDGVYTLSHTDITATNKVTVINAPFGNMTTTQLEEVMKLQIFEVTQSAGVISFKTLYVPTVEIPLRFIIEGR